MCRSSARATTACASGSTRANPARGLTGPEVVERHANAERAGRRRQLGQPPVPAGQRLSDRRQHAGPLRRSRAVRQRHRQERRRRAGGARARRRARRTRRPRLLHQQLLQRPARRRARALPAARARTRSTPPTRVEATLEELRARFPAGPRLRDRLRHDGVRRANRSPRSQQTVFEAVLLVVLVVDRLPAELARVDHSAGRGAGVAHRHVRRAWRRSASR